MGLLNLLRKKKTEMCCSAVVLAAGSSNRMGRDKIMLQIHGVPVIVHTLRAVEAVSEIEEIVVVTREDLIPEIAGLCKVFGIQKVVKIVRGGDSRAESSHIGVREVKPGATLVAVHDAARPFASVELIRTAVLKAAETGAAAPAIPVKDTIKVAYNGLIDHTPDRATLFAVQTPQVFDADLLRAALQKAVEDGAVITDDCSAVERLGMKVSLTSGDERNIKLTTPADLALAEVIASEV